jgi:hypothetical protein
MQPATDSDAASTVMGPGGEQVHGEEEDFSAKPFRLGGCETAAKRLRPASEGKNSFSVSNNAGQRRAGMDGGGVDGAGHSAPTVGGNDSGSAAGAAGQAVGSGRRSPGAKSPADLDSPRGAATFTKY